MTTRINGGIITDQMLSGSFRYFKMTATGTPFAYTIGSAVTTTENTYTVPETIIPGQYVVGDKESPKTYEKRIASGAPVANSVADRAFRVITEKCTVLMISLIDTDEIHFIVEGGSCGWDDDSDIQTAVRALGTIGDGVVGDPYIPDNTTNGAAAYDTNGITVTEVLTPVFTV